MKRRLTTLSALTASLALAAALAAAPAGATPERGSAPRFAEPRVRGLDGQASLRLDLGRALAGYPLLRQQRSDRRSPQWLAPVEKARLDARRIAFASKLTRAQQLQRFIAIVQHRLPPGPSEDARYEAISQAEVSRSGEARLSRYVAQRSGRCRERAFLLSAMLREAGIPAAVRYGVVFDSEQRYAGGHAWVEAALDGERRLLDPSMFGSAEPMPAVRPVVQDVGGVGRRVTTLQTRDLTYVPTHDLRFDRGRP